MRTPLWLGLWLLLSPLGVLAFGQDVPSATTVPSAAGVVGQEQTPAATLDRTVAARGATPGLLPVAETLPLSGDVAIPKSLELSPLPGGIIRLNGHTLTIKSPFAPGRRQVFQGPGTVVFGSGSLADGRILPDWFGAASDGRTDGGAAIQQAFDAAAASTVAGFAPAVFFPAGQGYRFSTPLACRPNIGVIAESPLLYAGEANATALTIGADDAKSRATYKISLINVNQSDWSSEKSIGVKFINLYDSSVVIDKVEGFTIGTQLLGSNKCFCYNDFKLDYIINNKIGLDICSVDNGCVNENLFRSGRFSVYTNINREKSRYGIRIFSADGTYVQNNDNIFLKPCFELFSKLASPGEALPILMQDGQSNIFYSCRNEGNGDTFVREYRKSQYNVYNCSYGSGIPHPIAYDKSALYRASLFTGPEAARGGFRDNVSPIWHSGHLPTTIVAYDRMSYYLPGLHVANAIDGKIANNIEALYLTAVTPSFLEITAGRSVGVFVDTSISKTFNVVVDSDPEYSGRIVVRCYAADGTILTPSDHSYVRAYSANPGYFTPQWGGVYTTGKDRNNWYFSVDEAVKKIAVEVVPGNRPVRLRGFSIAADKTATVWSGLPFDNAPVAMQAPEPAPSPITYALGQVITNARPAPGRATAWVVTQAGTLGLFHTSGSIVLGSTHLRLDDERLFPGQYVTVDGAGPGGTPLTRARIVSVAKDGVELDQKAGATVAKGTVAYTPPVFHAAGTILPQPVQKSN